MPRRERKGLIAEIVMALALAAICAPGVIWWALTLWDLAT
jgi:hypothetical protein